MRSSKLWSAVVPGTQAEVLFHGHNSIHCPDLPHVVALAVGHGYLPSPLLSLLVLVSYAGTVT